LLRRAKGASASKAAASSERRRRNGENVEQQSSGETMAWRREEAVKSICHRNGEAKTSVNMKKE